MLFRRSMRQPRNIEPPPGLIDAVSQVIKDMSREQIVALPQIIEQAERNIIRRLEKIMHTLDDVLDRVTSQRTQIDSLVALTRGLHQQVVEAMGATLTPSQQDRIERIFAAVQDNADAVAAAVKENTVEATAGAVSGGPDLSGIKASQAAAGGAGDPNAPVVPPPNVPDSPPAAVPDSVPTTDPKAT